ncbi:hypothetical protein ACFVQ3_05300 [Oerskovia sp. NPDC057915]|uniref:hypothetical protein n=1 Tax=Oerskovia sp. NPDC057915 TaxID=3346280 RepID=UPI0036DA2455
MSQPTSPTLQPFPASSAQAHQARHLLALPGDVEVDEVETLAVSRFAGARWDVAPSGTDPLTPAPRTARPGEPGVLRTSRHTTLTGPYSPWSADGVNPGLPPGTEQVFDVVCPRDRGAVPIPGGGDRDGVGRAFPAGLPTREEERVISWLVEVARRLGGSIRVDTADAASPVVVLTPDPGVAVNMSVFSDVWLDPQAAVAVVGAVHPRVVLATEGNPYQGPPQGIGELPLYRGETLDPELRRALHAQADDIDIAALTSGKILDGYGLLIDMGVDGLVAVEVGGEEQLPLLLRNLPWASQGAVAYRVRWEPRDLVESQMEVPSFELKIARKRAAELVATVTRALYAAVGGEIADEADFLVDPQDV